MLRLKTWAFFWLALRTLTFGGFYMNCSKEAKSLTFRRGSEVSQETLPVRALFGGERRFR